MPMLGDMLAAARDSAGEFQASLSKSDPDMAANVARAADAMGLSYAAYVRCAVADFTRFASEEDWATLTSSMRDSDDPGTVCLLAMVDWRMKVAACSSHAVGAE